MIPPSHHPPPAQHRRHLPALLLAATLAAPAALGCGPFFPNPYLVNNLPAFSQLPTLAFDAELARLLPPGAQAPAPADPGYRNPWQDDHFAHDRAAELAEWDAALAAAGLPETDRSRLLARADRLQPPAQLPTEFHLYARGAAAWHAGRAAEAVAAWEQLASLPPRDRSWRGVWAAYMLGRATHATDPAAARGWYRTCREWAGSGSRDALRLAPASLGWEARLHLDAGDVGEAMRTYFEQWKRGDAGAAPSLQRCLHRVFGPDAPHRWRRSSLARDPLLRGITHAWFVSRGGPHAPWGPDEARAFGDWLDTLRDSGAAIGPAEAARLAWAAYQSARWDDARHWCDASPPDDPAARWVRAMLLVRAGFIDEAADHLAAAARAFPQAPEPPPLASPAGIFDPFDGDLSIRTGDLAADIDGLRGTLALQRGRFTDALRLFLHAGHWQDAAYVAERVLTLDELLAFVDAEVPAPAPPAPEAGFPTTDWEVRLARDPAARSALALRHLLARRLLRARRHDDAERYFPAHILPVATTYRAAVVAGFDASRPDHDRAVAFWQAAVIAREHGIDLLGTELDPDMAMWDGAFGSDGSEPSRWRLLDPENEAGPLTPRDGERERVEAHRVPERRFHYRWRAAELAFWSASLLPNHQETTARVLHAGGRWIAPRDREGANRFYQAIVLRCGDTPLGREVAARRWFAPGSHPPELPPPALP